MKKIGLMLVALALILSACGSDSTASGDINVVSREDGSGTRGAFIELFDIEKEDESGEKVDYTLETADITNSTAVMLTSVENNENAIGYISLGSLKDTVKALKIDGALPNQENIKNGSYKIARDFNLVTKGKLDKVTLDFMDYVLSKQGQKIVEDSGYITSLDGGKEYSKSNIKGKIVVSGSSSVSPLMEKLIEGYKKLNKEVNIELQTSDSTTGINSVRDGIAEIGMSSRNLKDSEKNLDTRVVAIDGIAIIVNKAKELEVLSKEDVRDIYTGKKVNWGDFK